MTIHFSTLFLVVSLSTSAVAAEMPAGQKTPEGVACDAVIAYINSDSKAWLAIVVRPIYGKENDAKYADFKKQMAATFDANKKNPKFKSPRFIKCYKARQFSLKGPASAAFALADFADNMFVDLVIELAPGRQQLVRSHVLKDKDGLWYFDPRPDLNPLFSAGLNEEAESTKILYKSK